MTLAFDAFDLERLEPAVGPGQRSAGDMVHGDPEDGPLDRNGRSVRDPDREWFACDGAQHGAARAVEQRYRLDGGGSGRVAEWDRVFPRRAHVLVCHFTGVSRGDDLPVVEPDHLVGEILDVGE